MKFGFSRRTIISLGIITTCLSLVFLYYVSSDSSYSSNHNNSFITDDDGALTFSGNYKNNNLKTVSEQPKCLKNTATRDLLKPTKEQWEQCLEPGMEPSYYLSVVIVTRMDDYAG